MNSRIVVMIFIALWACQSVAAKIHSSGTNLADTSKDTSLILIGDVTDVTSLNVDRLASIKVSKVLKGATSAESVNAFFYGPMTGVATNDIIEEMERRVLQFAKGEKVLVFLNPAPGGYFTVAHLDYGKLVIFHEEDTDKVRIPRYYQDNNKLNPIEPLEKVTQLIESFSPAGK